MMAPFIPKLVALAGKASNFTGYVFGGGGVVIAAFGAVNANAAQAWVGALVACITAVWGLYRDQKAHDRDQRTRERQDTQNAKDESRHDVWTAFVTKYRMDAILQTGKDPFAAGTPPLDFLEAAEMAGINHNAPPQVLDTHVTTTDQKPVPAGPKWPSIRHLFG
jgi:hypothetical protein